jgi:hypothetical protein
MLKGIVDIIDITATTVLTGSIDIKDITVLTGIIDITATGITDIKGIS